MHEGPSLVFLVGMEFVLLICRGFGGSTIGELFLCLM